ncbi:hypothetical protein ACI8AA_14620 [Geodermatophilus sp. SYSU D01180]
MTSAGDPGLPRPAAELSGELRRMALHLETAAVLELRAQRTTDPVQVAVLRRRAEHRRREADRLRERLAACGVALPRGQRAPGATPA